MNHLLHISNYSCGYASKFSIEVEDLTINKGDFVGIIGPNGAGKTTFFKGITGELEGLSGKILFNGDNLQIMKRRGRAQRLAIVNQNIGNPQISVEEYVLLGRVPFQKSLTFIEKKEDIEIAQHFMRLTKTFAFRHKMMTELSGGEQQLAAIARALTQQPELLLLDEPTAHLDIFHSVSVLNLLQQLNEQENLTIIMVIHDLNLASEYCERLVMMKNGSVFAKGTPEQVLTYKNIEEVYRTPVLTQANPLSNKPSVFLVSQKVLKNNQRSNTF